MTERASDKLKNWLWYWRKQLPKQAARELDQLVPALAAEAQAAREERDRVIKYAEELLEALQSFFRAREFGKFQANLNLPSAEQRLGLVLAELRARSREAKS